MSEQPVHPTQGRIVSYADRTGAVWPAIVVFVHALEKDQEYPSLSLQVFTRSEIYSVDHAPHGQDHDRWFWPTRV